MFRQHHLIVASTLALTLLCAPSITLADATLPKVVTPDEMKKIISRESEKYQQEHNNTNEQTETPTATNGNEQPPTINPEPTAPAPSSPPEEPPTTTKQPAETLIAPNTTVTAPSTNTQNSSGKNNWNIRY